MPDCVISNTSPLFYLHRLGCLDMLRKLYGKIIVPEAVVYELNMGRMQGEETPEIADYDWIEVRSINVPHLVRLVTDFGAGETEVLALALENPDCLAILDDRLAREVASLHRLRITGTAGVLLKAKQAGYLSAVAPLLNELERVGFRLSDTVKINILSIAGE